MTRKLLIWALLGLVIAGLSVGMIYFDDWAWSASWLGYGVVGGLILLKRSENAIGWLLLAISLVWALDFTVLVIVERLDTPGAVWLEMVGQSLGYSAWLLLILIPVIFPSGRPAGRFASVLRTALFAALAVVVISEFLSSTPKEITGAVSPLAVPALAGFTRFVVDDGFIIVPLLLILSLASLVMRWRRSQGIERLQFRWLLAAIGFVIVGLFLVTLSDSVDPLIGLIFPVVLNSIPIAIGIAVLRYRLYDIDLVINRSVLFLLLATFITVVYAVVVVGLSALGTQGELVPSIAATAVIALAFEPVRLRAQRWADRVAYGKRATPYEVLSDLTQRLASTESTEGLLNRTAQRLADGTGAERAGVWVAAEEGGFLLGGRWPQDSRAAVAGGLEDLPGTVVEIEADGERLGALTVEKRRGDSVTPTENRLIQDLAGSSAPLLQNLSLQAELEANAEELAASRRRLVEVQAQERRRLERDLDEGAQQLVVSLKVKLNVAARLARAEAVEPLAAMLEGMDQEARQAITQIRSLARGLYPQLLEADGLAAAVRSIAEFGSVPVEVEAHGIRRFPAELEATAYFCILEAITNAAKHAPGRVVKVKLQEEERGLVFSVRDEGPGFDRAKIKPGSGLRNMADRLDAAGGRLDIITAPGEGTTLTGTIPLPQKVPA